MSSSAAQPTKPVYTRTMDESGNLPFLRESPDATLDQTSGLAMQDPLHTALALRSAQQDEVIAVPPALRKLADEATSTQDLLEIVIDKSNFLPACFLQVGAGRARAVCKINAEGVNYVGKTGRWSGTGFLVSKNILLTNHHVLNSPDVARNGIAIFNYEMDPDGQPLATKGFRLKPDELFLTSPVANGLDFTFVRVDGDPGEEFGFIPLDRTATTIVADEFANIIQHPSGNPKIVVLQENQVKFQDVAVVHYTSDTEPGSSGSCVFNNEWRPIALHHASKPGSGDFKFLNEGLKFSAIATLLEQLQQQGQNTSAGEELLGLFRGTDALMGFFGALGRQVPAGGPSVEVVVNSYKGEADDIDVGFWNIEWFNRRVDEKVDDVAQVIVKMNLDVWALEESSPEATQALVDHLNRKYHMKFHCASSEPQASPQKQTTTVIWNEKTVTGQKQKWPDEIETWLQVRSENFAELGLEAVEGKVFDRYPGLFYFTALGRDGRKSPFNFYLVPLHLKAMAEGSKRRRMAAQIIGAAVKTMVEKHAADQDWVIGGDFNAELASEDFNRLMEGGMVPLSAEDEEGGAFSYVKRPKSLIDHIFLSANMGTAYGAKDYFIVAKDKTIPGYVKKLSDHRPVLVRLSLKNQPGEGEPESAAIPESLKTILSKLRPVM